MTQRDGREETNFTTASNHFEWKGSRAFDMADNDLITRAEPRNLGGTYMTTLENLTQILADLEEVAGLVQGAMLVAKNLRNKDNAAIDTNALPAILDAIMNKLDYPRDAVSNAIEAIRPTVA